MKCIVKMNLLLVVVGMSVNIGFAADMKKVMIFHSGTGDTMMASCAIGALAEAGFEDQKNLTIEQVVVSSATDFAQLAAQVRESAPDVIISLTSYITQVVETLQGLPLPIVASIADSYVDAEGMPVANVTGVYNKLPDMVYNSYKFLQKVAPLKPGQQVVFLEIPEHPVVTRAEVVDALQRLHIPLKAVVDTTIYEDWQQAILQYSDDPDVGWILFAVSPMKKRDGSHVERPRETTFWEREHMKKPRVMYWEISAQQGTLCAFGIDLNKVGEQCGTLAARILQGEDVKTIKAEYPQKVSIALNRKTATNLGIVFSLDVLKLADVIYDDYEGKQVIRK